MATAPRPAAGPRRRNHWPAIVARSTLHLGVLGERRRLFWSLPGRRAPGHLSRAIQHAIQSEHLIRYTREDVLPRHARALEAVRAERGRAAIGGRGPLLPMSARPALA